MSEIKAKFKITQLAAKSMPVELVHPVHGETGIIFQIIGPHSKVFQEARRLYRDSDKTEEDSIKLFSACVIGWDTEAMEMEYTEDNCYSFFSAPENEWVTTFLAPIIKDELNFYEKK